MRRVAGSRQDRWGMRVKLFAGTVAIKGRCLVEEGRFKSPSFEAGGVYEAKYLA